MQASGLLAPGAGRDVLVEVLRHGPLPRTRLAQRLSLSAGSLTRLSRDLVDSKLLVERGPTSDPDTGRPTRPLDVSLEHHRFAGFNVTRDTVWGVMTDLRAGVVARGARELASSDPRTVTATMATLLDEMERDQAPSVTAWVGVALGGHVGRDGRIDHATLLDWDAPVDLVGALEDATGRQVSVSNDLAALVRAEHWFGAGRGSSDLAVLTIGAGVGYALIINDRIVETPDTGLQLLGHHRLADTGPSCDSGHHGCATAMLTVPGITAQAALELGRSDIDWTTLLGLADPHATDTYEAGGGVVARELLDDRAVHLGHLVAAIANFTAVGRVLVTGEGAGLYERAEATVRAALADHRDPLAAAVAVTAVPHDFHQWARGAAGSAIQQWLSVDAAD